jgi:hypothetical protein
MSAGSAATTSAATTLPRLRCRDSITGTSAPSYADPMPARIRENTENNSEFPNFAII